MKKSNAIRYANPFGRALSLKIAALLLKFSVGLVYVGSALATNLAQS